MAAGMTRGNLYVVSAPSGGGKTSLTRALVPLLAEQGVQARISVSYTTRAPRPGEADGVHYHFVDESRFIGMIERGEFFEHAEVFGRRYGTGRARTEELLAAGTDVILDIDWQGGRQVRRLAPEAQSIFILPPSLEVLEQRLKTRSQDQPAAIARRLAAAREEIGHFREFDYVIINKDFNRAALELASIIRAERLRLPRQLARNADLINGMQ